MISIRLRLCIDFAIVIGKYQINKNNQLLSLRRRRRRVCSLITKPYTKFKITHSLAVPLSLLSARSPAGVRSHPFVLSVCVCVCVDCSRFLSHTQNFSWVSFGLAC